MTGRDDAGPHPSVGQAIASPSGRWRRRLLPLTLILLVLGLLISTLCSELYRLRDVVEGNNCTSNLRQLGLANKMYANGHADALPASWEDVAATQELTPDVFLCPATANSETRAEGNTQAEWASHIDNPAGAHCSYAYLGRGFTDRDFPTDAVLAIEYHDKHPAWGINLLFGDGSVETLRINSNEPDRRKYEHFLADAISGVRPLRLRP